MALPLPPGTLSVPPNARSQTLPRRNLKKNQVSLISLIQRGSRADEILGGYHSPIHSGSPIPNFRNCGHFNDSLGMIF